MGVLGVLGMLVVMVGFAGAEADKSEKKAKGRGAFGRDPEATFKKMDANSDGKVTKEEFLSFLKENRPSGGKATPEQAQTRAEGAWKRMAGSKDSLTLDEYKTAVKEMQERFKQRKGKGGNQP